MHVIFLAAALATTADTPVTASPGAQDRAEPAAVVPAETPTVFFDLEALTTIGAARHDSAVGHEVAIRGLRVDEVDAAGFWVTAGSPGQRMFVFPAERDLIQVQRGDVVNIYGDVRLAPEQWQRRPSTLAGTELLIYAFTVRPVRTVERSRARQP
jgi:hypothetical protein